MSPISRCVFSFSASAQATLMWWFGLVVWGLDPQHPNNQTKPPNKGKLKSGIVHLIVGPEPFLFAHLLNPPKGQCAAMKVCPGRRPSCEHSCRECRDLFSCQGSGHVDNPRSHSHARNPHQCNGWGMRKRYGGFLERKKPSLGQRGRLLTGQARSNCCYLWLFKLKLRISFRIHTHTPLVPDASCRLWHWSQGLPRPFFLFGGEGFWVDAGSAHSCQRACPLASFLRRVWLRCGSSKEVSREIPWSWKYLSFAVAQNLEQHALCMKNQQGGWKAVITGEHKRANHTPRVKSAL